MAVWDSYKLTQLTPDGFQIQKRTNPKSAWINVLGGKRSLGDVFIGDVSGGLSIDLKNFWKLYPTEMEIKGAGNRRGRTDDVALVPRRPGDGHAALRRRSPTAWRLLTKMFSRDIAAPYGVARTSELDDPPLCRKFPRRRIASAGRRWISRRRCWSARRSITTG